ncbi:hypothetical protein LMG29542_07357 [Paraburkholderia humisilvae]|uniref:DZANK-type domain-containing protein n=2 Tax=Paraburkholderia humisilvae TaxID=627669 RepID=A0A6J5F465_9BURK|nr:hypothetical protein LMG29542_07357 [Paraburkholderia humisilvae]
MSIWEKMFRGLHGDHRGNGDHHRENGHGRHHRHTRAYIPYHDTPPVYSRASNKLAAAGQICSLCNVANPTDARFCNQCGTSLTPSTCKKCNGALQIGARFCGKCGTPII